MEGAAAVSGKKTSSYTYWVRGASSDAAPLPVPKKIDPADLSNQPNQTHLGSAWNRELPTDEVMKQLKYVEMVDLTESRYLLAGASDATVAVYDIQRATDYEGRGLIAKHKSLLTINKQHEHGHKYAISSAIWYPIDTGMFVTGSYDHHINVWDTNTSQVVMNFKMPGKVYRNAMSSIARSHMLIATGTEDVQVRLCDMGTGASAHTLSGHRVGKPRIKKNEHHISTSSQGILGVALCTMENLVCFCTSISDCSWMDIFHSFFNFHQ